ncbi:hypothetical protein JTB14_011895 [Gonioctena quinquepunctata]|nr:hypothetical protein JTB14_011895 [Gonioctena quinquepunctata]
MTLFNYDDGDMKKAKKAVEKGSPTATAAESFEVPRMTLSDKFKGKTPMQRKMGPPSILSTKLKSKFSWDELKLFKESGPTWLHEMEFTESFKIWHKIDKSISGEDTETALENQDLTSSLDNEIFDDISNNLLPEN